MPSTLTSPPGSDRESALPQAPSHAPAPAPLWALGVVTWFNSFGSGILWSGVPFVTERQYGFTQGENLALAIAQAVIYVVVALTSGPVMRRAERAWGVTPRGWLAGVLVVQLVGSLLALAGAAGVVLASCMLSAIGATLWPLMESYVSSGRHGGAMRRAIGIFNVTWMSATGAALLVMAPLVGTGSANLSLLALVPVSVVSLAMLRWFPARPAPHAHEHAHTHLAPNYPALLRATRYLIPLAYVFVSLLGPVMPFLLESLRMDDTWKTPLTSTWMFARMGTVMVLAMASFWHGRWGALALGIALMAGGFASVAMAPSAGAAFAGLLAFGVGHGILYYAGLYYAMAVGSADVDAGGLFEGLIGAGYVVGPLAGLAGSALAHGGGIAPQSGMVAAVGVVALLGIVPATVAYRRALPGRGTVAAQR